MTAYDPILSEVEAPEPYVIEDTVGVAEAFEPAFTEASSGDTAFANAAPATPIDRGTRDVRRIDRDTHLR